MFVNPNDLLTAGGWRLDAGETQNLANSLEDRAIQAIETLYPNLRARQAFPVVGGDEGATSFTWDRFERTRNAKVLANPGDDIPSVAQSLSENTGVYRLVASGFEYSDEDLRRFSTAQRRGYSAIDPRSGESLAIESVEAEFDVLAATGSSTFGLTGGLKDGNVTVLGAASPATGADKSFTGGDKTGAEILEDLHTCVRTVVQQSDGAIVPDTIVMPVDELEFLATKPLLPSSDNQITILQQFTMNMREIGRPMNMIAWEECATADASDTGPRLACYRRSPMVVGMHIPMPPRVHGPPTRKGMGWFFPVAGKFGGVTFFQPLGAVYMDDI